MAINKQKRLGQVFLKNQDIVQKIIQTAEIESKDQILEIGPGKGVLTEPLLQTGAEVTAIEKDPELVKFLKKRFRNKPNLKIIQADIRDLLQSVTWQNTIQNTEYKVIGNIPYYLTSHLLRVLLEHPIKPCLIVLMIQKEVSQRIIAQPPKMSLLSVSVQFYAKPEIICYVPKTAFSPKPKVDSAVIKIMPINTNANTNKTQIKTFFNVVKAGFRQPRKLLLNNVYNSLNIEKDKIKKIFEQSDISMNARPQNLSVKNWISLAQKLTFFLVN